MNGNAARDESHFTETLDQRIETELHDLGEDLRVILEGGLGAGLSGLGLADDLDRLLGIAALVALEIHVPIECDLHFAPL